MIRFEGEITQNRNSKDSTWFQASTSSAWWLSVTINAQEETTSATCGQLNPHLQDSDLYLLRPEAEIAAVVPGARAGTFLTLYGTNRSCGYFPPMTA
jgi:hypothetical protein